MALMLVKKITSEKCHTSINSALKGQRQKAIERINKNGVLLVFPINNRKEPHSLWSELHPRTKMNWDWDNDGDTRVFDMWKLMKELSSCREVVYSKWYQGRATFFSRELFIGLLSVLQKTKFKQSRLSRDATQLLDELESDSPLSTRDLKKLTDLQGKFNEPAYNRAMKDLFSQFLIVAFGEVDDGAFPSLAVGATKLIYEDLWIEAESLSLMRAQTLVDKWLPDGSHFRKFFDKICKNL
jgi:hypothetical protein